MEAERPTALSFGSELRRQRIGAGLSQSELARRTHYSKSHLSKVESGAKRPTLAVAQRCDRELSASGRLVSLLAATGPTQPAAAEPVDPTHSMSSDAAMTGWSFVPAPDQAGTAAALVAHFRSSFDELRRQGQILDPGAVGQLLIAAVGTLVRVADGIDPVAAAPALRLASRYAEFTGWMAQEKGSQDAARRWTDNAVLLARRGGDRELAIYAIVRRTELALYDDDARTMIGLAQQVQGLACSPRIRGFAALREAQGHAMTGDEPASELALDRARELMATAVEEAAGDPLLGSIHMTDPVAFATAWCLTELGRPAEASRILTRELARLPETAARTRARYGASLALALADSGDIDGSCEVARPVIARVGSVDSATIRKDLARLRRALVRRSGYRPVQQIMPDLVEALRTNVHAVG